MIRVANLLRRFRVRSFRARILLLLVGLVIVTMTASLVVVNSRLQVLTDETIHREYAKTLKTFRRFLSLQNTRLIESCLLISELPVLKAQISTRDHATIRDYFLEREESPQKLTNVDYFLITDEKGIVLFRTDSPEHHSDTLAMRPSIAQAVSGIDPAEDEIAIWVINNELYQIVTAPILQRYVIGTLTLGKRITHSEAIQLKNDTESEISFVLGNRIVASTLSDIAQLDMLRGYLSERAEVDSLIRSGVDVERRITLDGELFLCVFSLASQFSDALYVMSFSLDKAEEPAQMLEKTLILFGLGIMIAAGFGAYFFSKGVSAPVRRLANAMERVQKGDYSARLERMGSDEFAFLATAFNDMVVGLNERSVMSKFMSASTVEMIRKKGLNLQLGGDRRNVTVLFSDIRGFTSFSERVEPEKVIEVLNRYLSVQSRLVVEHSGYVDKYVGDEMVAVFEGEEMADNAVRCALDIQRSITDLNRSSAEPIKVGIGINTGMAIVGNVGSEERMDHTVLGSNMNLGSRLCGIAGPDEIIISESTARLLRSKDIRITGLQAIPVKGLERPVQIYSVERIVTT